jgi:hypothetical protein
MRRHLEVIRLRRAHPEVVAQNDEALGIVKQQWAEEHALNQREDGGSGSDAQLEREDDDEGKAGRLPKLPECETEIARSRGLHAQPGVANGSGTLQDRKHRPKSIWSQPQFLKVYCCVQGNATVEVVMHGLEE